MTGLWKSAFKGSGIEFDEVRPYSPGDDVRAIDWKVTSRMDAPFIKLYREEREMQVFFLVDCSASCRFALGGMEKSELIAEVVTLLAFAAIKNRDRVGLLLFTDEVEKYTPPRRGERAVHALLEELMNFTPKRRGTSIKTALSALYRESPKRSLLFLLSDFLGPVNYQKELILLSKQHELILIDVEDPLEKKLPDLPFVTAQDLETGERVTTSFKRDRESYEKARLQHKERVKVEAKRLGTELITLSTGGGFESALISFFKRKSH